jgi:hypothetical protein
MGKTTMRPSKPLSTGAVIILVFMLMFGIAFFALVHSVLKKEDAPFAMSIVFYIFMVGWIGTVLFQLVYHAMNLKRAKGVSLVDIESEPGLPEETAQSDPMQRLRNLEKLKSDGLITEEEFRRKREEIMREKW